MHTLKDIRLALGMGQKEFALVLGIERGHLSMIEADRKSLPEFVSEKLEIFKHIIATTTVDESIKPGASSASLHKLYRKRDVLEVEQVNQQKKLMQMQRDYKAFMLQKRVLSVVLDSHNPNSEQGTKLKVVLDALLKEIDAVSPAEQVVVQMRIDEITHSLVLIKRAIADMDKMI